ncbi:MAG: T9SS type A sorting domain-containing protein [Taibaiella sp.]|nr:T9SS type A sorting domain-containing protein [Taibaiella sp.]
MNKYILILLIFFPSYVCGQGTNAVYLTNGTQTAASSLNSTYSTPPNWYKNLEKYWFYRYRLINDFLIIGDGAGMSIPAQRREFYNSSNTVNRGLTGTNNGHSLQWSDATIGLGHYLTVLATEYKMLSLNGFSTDSTEKELDYAQSALFRLTNNSHAYQELSAAYHNQIYSYPGNAGITPYLPNYGHHTSSGTNDFFIRDDVPYLTFVHDNLAHFNRQKLVSNFTDDREVVRYTGSSAYAGRYDGPNPLAGSSDPSWNFSPSFGCYSGLNWCDAVSTFPEQESQDQLVDIYLGEHFVQKYLPAGSTLRNEARNFICNTIKRPTSNPFCKLKNNASPYDCVYGLAPSGGYSCSNGGGLFFVNAPAAIPAANISCGGCSFTAANVFFGQNPFFINIMEYLQHVNPVCTFPGFGGAPFIAYKDMYFTDAFNAVSRKYTFNIPLIVGIGGMVGTPALIHSLSLPASAWGAFFAVFGTVATINAASYWTSFLQTPTSWGAIKRHAGSNGNAYPNLPLVFELEYGDMGWYMAGPGSALESLFDRAPACGIYNYRGCNPMGGSSYSAYPHSIPDCDDLWSSNDLFSEWYHRDNMSPCYENKGLGDYNGLDYMELFNLYSLERGGTSTSYLQGLFNPLYCDNFNITFPDANGFGSTTNKLKLSFLQHLSTINHVTPTGGLILQCAKRVDMLPGFIAEPGSFYQAQVRDYGCHGGITADGEYHFAMLNPVAGVDFKPGRTAASAENDKWIPIAYLTDSKPFLGAELPEPDPAEFVGDSLLGDSTINAVMSALYKLAIFTDTSVDESFKEEVLAYVGMLDEYKKFAPVWKMYRESTLSVIVVPNPTTNISYLEFTLPKSTQIQIKLANSIGQDISALVESYDRNAEPGKHRVAIDLSSVPPGMYYVTFLSEHSPVTTKIIKL